MKKTKKSLLVLSSVLLLAGCSNNTIDEERTIVLEIESDVTPQITTNFGQGNYDDITNKYTHTISSIKDLYITLSYDDLKTVTVHIPTSEMKDKTINKKVKFGDVLDAEVEVTINGVKTLNGITFDDNNEISDVVVGDKNKFKFKVPSRDKNYNIKFQLPGYREFDIELNKESLITGVANIDTIAMNADQVYIALDGSNFSYKVYSYLTNELVSSGSKDYYDSSREYILLENNQKYYVQLYNYNNGATHLYDTNINQDTIIQLNEGSHEYIGYLQIKENGEYFYNSYVFYNKKTKEFSNSNSIYNSFSSLGLLVQNKNGKWAYFDDLTTAVYDSEYGDYIYNVDYNNSIEVNFNVTRIHRFTSEVISSGMEENFYPYNDTITEVELSDKTFNVIVYENETDTLNVDLYDSQNNKISTIPVNIYSNFSERIISGTINYQGKKVPYQFPLFIKDIIYDNGEISTNLKPIVDTKISLIEISFIDKNGNSSSLNSSAYILSSDGMPILKTDLGDGRTYFQLEENQSYVLHNGNNQYNFTLTKEKIINGQFLIVDEKVKIAKFKIPDGYNITLNYSSGIMTQANQEGIATYYTNEENGFINICIDNGVGNICIDKEFNTNEINNIGAFYYIKNSSFVRDNSLMYDHSYDYSYIFYYIEDPNKIETLPLEIEHIVDGSSKQLVVNKDDFIYDQNINAYVFDLEAYSDYILEGNTSILTLDNYYRIGSKYFIKNTHTLTFNGDEYDLSSYAKKRLFISSERDDILQKYVLKINELD